MGARGALGGQPQHFRAERGQDQAARRDPVGQQGVHVAGKRVVGLGVLLGHLGVARAHAEQEPSREPVLDPPERRGDLVRLVLPHVHDAGGHDEGGRRGQELLGGSQVPGGRAQPEGAEPEFLDARRQFRRDLALAPPDAEPSELVARLLSHPVRSLAAAPVPPRLHRGNRLRPARCSRRP